MTYWPNGTSCYDTVTNPFVDEDGNAYYYKYDQDECGWVKILHLAFMIQKNI